LDVGVNPFHALNWIYHFELNSSFLLAYLCSIFSGYKSVFCLMTLESNYLWHSTNWILNYYENINEKSYRLYRVSTKELHTFKMMKKTNLVYLELYNHTGGYKNSQKFCFKWPGWLLLLHASARCHYFLKWLPTTKELVYSAVNEKRACNSCVMCIWHTVSYRTTHPSIHLLLVQ
jgi:hypothetical protein